MSAIQFCLFCTPQKLAPKRYTMSNIRYFSYNGKVINIPCAIRVSRAISFRYTDHMTVLFKVLFFVLRWLSRQGLQHLPDGAHFLFICDGLRRCYQQYITLSKCTIFTFWRRHTAVWLYGKYPDVIPIRHGSLCLMVNSQLSFIIKRIQKYQLKGFVHIQGREPKVLICLEWSTARFMESYVFREQNKTIGVRLQINMDHPLFLYIKLHRR